MIMLAHTKSIWWVQNCNDDQMHKILENDHTLIHFVKKREMPTYNFFNLMGKFVPI
jgi:hypothetical protein